MFDKFLNMSLVDEMIKGYRVSRYRKLNFIRKKISTNSPQLTKTSEVSTKSYEGARLQETANTPLELATFALNQ